MDFFGFRFLPSHENGFQRISSNFLLKNRKELTVKRGNLKIKKKKILIKKRGKFKGFLFGKKNPGTKKNLFSRDKFLPLKFQTFLSSIKNVIYFSRKTLPQVEKLRLVESLKFCSVYFQKFSSGQKIDFLIFLSFFSKDQTFEIRHEVRKIILKITKSYGMSTLIPLLREELGNKKEEIRRQTVEILILLIGYQKFTSYFPFFRAFFSKTREWRIRFSVYQIFEKISRDSENTGFLEFKERISLTRKALNEKKKKLRGIGASIFCNLCRKIRKNNLRSLSRLFFLIFDRLKKEKGYNLAIFVKAGRSFLKLFDSKKNLFFLRELFEISLENLPNPRINTEKIFLETISIYLEKINPRHKNIFEKISKFLKSNLQNFKKTTSKKNFFLYSKIFFWFISKKPTQTFSLIPVIKPLIRNIDNILVKMDLIELYLRNRYNFQDFSGVHLGLFDDLISIIQESMKVGISNKIKFLLKKTHKNLVYFVRIRGVSDKQLFPRFAGLLKWEINHPEFFIRKCAFKTIKKIGAYFKKSRERIILGHLGVILFNHLKDIEPPLLEDLILGLNSVIRRFPPDYCIPPLNKIIPDLLSVLQKEKLENSSSLEKIFSTIIRKGSIFLPKKEQFRLIDVLVKILQRFSIRPKKFLIMTISKLSARMDPLRVTRLLVIFLKEKNKKFGISLSMILSFLALYSGPHFVFPSFLGLIGSIKNIKKFNLFFALLCFLEVFDSMNLPYYMYSICLILRKILELKDDSTNPIIFVLIGQVFRKTRKFGWDNQFFDLFEKVWGGIKFMKKESLKYILFSIKALPPHCKTSGLFPFLLQGLFYFSGKRKRAFWKFLIFLENKIFSGLINFYPISWANRFTIEENF